MICCASDMNVGIVGCGLIGKKRAQNLGQHKVIAAADIELERARALVSDDYAFDNWQDLIAIDDIDIVIVATTHDILAEIALAAIKSGKHVLVEKPAARHADELRPLIAASEEQDVLVHVGFNHRYHPAFQKAYEIFKQGELGPLMFIRARYGHGGRIGYEKEWRANPEISGGGELLDQGSHLIDLSQWFLGHFDNVSGYIDTYFWDMTVEDNAFMMLRTAKNQMAWLHVSWTEWKNLFSFEIYGRDAKLHIEGLGGSYGVERLSYYKMLPEMGPPETMIWEFPGKDRSWELEFNEFIEDIHHKREPSANLHSALAVLEVVELLNQGNKR